MAEYIILTPAQLESLLARAVAKGVRAAQEPFISRRQAEREYGKATIARLVDNGLIGYRQGAAANAKVLFERDAIERAIQQG